MGRYLFWIIRTDLNDLRKSISIRDLERSRRVAIAPSSKEKVMGRSIFFHSVRNH
jgi:hypothetical protein